MALMRMGEGRYQSVSPEDTERFGELVAPCLEDGDVLVLTGGLGAGKTQFTKGVSRGLGDAHPRHEPHLCPDGGTRWRAVAALPL